MLYKLRTGDILLCENKQINKTNAYLIVHDTLKGFGLWCMECGEALGFYGKDTEKMKEDIMDKNFLNIQNVVPKETIAEYLNKTYHTRLPIKSHDGYNELDIEIELQIDEETG